MEKIVNNYAAQAEAGLNVYDWYYDTAIRLGNLPFAVTEEKYWKEKQTITRLKKQILDSQHFMLPEGGKLFNDNFKGIEGVQVRLPYPKITVAYAEKDDEGGLVKNLLLVQEKKIGDIRLEHGDFMAPEFKALDDIEIFIEMVSFTHSQWLDEVKKGFWLPNSTISYVYSKWDDFVRDSPNTHIVGKVIEGKAAVGLSCRVLSQFTIFLETEMQQHSSKKSIEEMSNQCATRQSTKFRSVLELCEALSCRNVQATVAQEASPKNDKRIKAGKLPIYETKILTIDCPGTEYERGEGIPGAIGAKKRQHLRRGHIRRLPSGNIWVNACVVGSPDNGVIDKSYRVKKTDDGKINERKIASVETSDI